MSQPSISLPQQEYIEIPDTAIIKVWKTFDAHCEDDGALFFVSKELHDIIVKSKQFNNQITFVQSENGWYQVTKYRDKTFKCHFKGCKKIFYLVPLGPTKFFPGSAHIMS